MNNYRDLMNSKSLIEVKEFKNKIEKGMLIGFKAFGDKISAAYPIWEVRGDEVLFILCYRNHDKKPILDNTCLNSPGLYINEDPIKVEVNVDIPTTFTNELIKLFGSR